MKSPDVELIDPWALPSVELDSLDSMPGCAAIYFVIDGPDLIYIGKSVCLAARWKSHHRLKQLQSDFPSAKVYWLELSRDHPLKSIERDLISRLSPKLNRSPGNGVSKPNSKFGKRSSVRFPPWYHKRIIWLAAVKHLPVAGLVQNFMQDWLEAQDALLESMIKDLAKERGITTEQWKSNALKKHGYR